MRCKICNAYIPEGATRCLDCGADMEESFLCPQCGTRAIPEARFCRICGLAFTDQPESVPLVRKGSRQAQPVSVETFPCARCDSPVPVGESYCPSCGTNQAASKSQTAQPHLITPAKQKEVDEPVAGIDASDPAPAHGPCPRCGTIPRGTGRFCYNCGRFLGGDIEDVLCAACGAANILRYTRCQYCGADLPRRPESGT